jgi:hypothetical protein
VFAAPAGAASLQQVFAAAAGEASLQQARRRGPVERSSVALSRSCCKHGVTLSVIGKTGAKVKQCRETVMFKAS